MSLPNEYEINRAFMGQATRISMFLLFDALKDPAGRERIPLLAEKIQKGANLDDDERHLAALLCSAAVGALCCLAADEALPENRN